VIDADAAVRAAFTQPNVQMTLRLWWGDAVVRADKAVDRAAIAGKVFGDPAERERLERLLHPIVAADRMARMAAALGDASVAAFVWDVPLLMETGLDRECDELVFVDAPRPVRLQRLAASRRWSEADLLARENCQIPLDKKRSAAHDVIVNTAADDEVRSQVRAILTRILERTAAHVQAPTAWRELPGGTR
jgi:dephospho-CoA kinase